MLDQIAPYLLSAAAFIGTYCLILANDKQYEIEKVLKNGIRATGTVVEIHNDPKGEKGAAPIVEYTTQNGRHRHVSTTYTSPCNYRVGQEVAIWYKTNKTSRISALADDKPGNLPKVLLRWGIVLCLLSYPILLKRMTGLF